MWSSSAGVVIPIPSRPSGTRARGGRHRTPRPPKYARAFARTAATPPSACSDAQPQLAGSMRTPRRRSAKKSFCVFSHPCSIRKTRAWSSGRRSRADLGPVSGRSRVDLGSISGRSRADLGGPSAASARGRVAASRRWQSRRRRSPRCAAVRRSASLTSCRAHPGGGGRAVAAALLSFRWRVFRGCCGLQRCGEVACGLGRAERGW